MANDITSHVISLWRYTKDAENKNTEYSVNEGSGGGGWNTTPSFFLPAFLGWSFVSKGVDLPPPAPLIFTLCHA